VRAAHSVISTKILVWVAARNEGVENEAAQLERGSHEDHVSEHIGPGMVEGVVQAVVP